MILLFISYSRSLQSHILSHHLWDSEKTVLTKNYCLDSIYETLNIKYKIHYEFYNEQAEPVSMLVY